MAQLSELNKELDFSKNLLTLIETLKSIAVSQYHMMEKEKERFAAFMEAFAEFFRVVSLSDVDHPLVRNESSALGLVVVTSDSGFMGGLNAGVIGRAMELRGDLADEHVRWVVMGERGATYFSEHQIPFRFFRGIELETRYEQAVELREHLVEEVKEGRMGRVMMAYPRPVSFSQQTVESIPVLPCSGLFGEGGGGAEPWEGAGWKGYLAQARRVVVESEAEDMVSYLSEVYVTSRLYEVFEDSKLAEFSARAMHLEGSGQKLEKELEKLKHRVSRARHELVDKGMRESFGARATRRRRSAA